MLTYLYLFSMIVGFVLLGASILLGGHDDADLDVEGGDADLDASADADVEVEADADAEGGLDKDVGVGGHGDFFGGILYSFGSLRFWTFFLAFFGLTGIVLDGLDLVSSSWVALGLASVMGVVTGLGATTVIRRLTADTTGAATRDADYIGRSARVLVPFEGEGLGKVRVEVKGSQVDLLATGIDEGAYGTREEVLIVELDGTRARVAKVDEAKAGRG